MAKGSTQKAAQGSGHGYWLYDDGYSYWGINIIRFGQVGVQISEELHKKPVEEKLKWYMDDADKKAVVALESAKKPA